MESQLHMTKAIYCCLTYNSEKGEMIQYPAAGNLLRYGPSMQWPFTVITGDVKTTQRHEVKEKNDLHVIITM